MKNISSRRNILKDAAILLAIAALLIALPWTQDFLNRGEESSSLEQSAPLDQSEEGGFIPTTDLAVTQKQKAFIEEVFPLVSSWQVDALEPYLATATKSGDWSVEIASVLSILSDRLGPLERYSEPTLIHVGDTPAGSKDTELAVYEFIAHYETGVADINLVLADNGGEPALYSFNINVNEPAQAL